MLKHKAHKLTSILLAMALVITPFATLQAAVWAVMDCPDKTMTMSSHGDMGHNDMNHGNMTHTDTDDMASADTTPCPSMDNGCHVSVQFSAVTTGHDSLSPEMLSSFEPTPNQSFSAVTLPTEIKPPISV